MRYEFSIVILFCLTIISYLVKNTAVSIAILSLLIMKLTPLNYLFPYIEKQGIHVGIIILTIAVMSPLVSGSLPTSYFMKSFSNWESIVAIVTGIFVAWLGTRGINFITLKPSIVGSILVGTIIGVACFHGVPVGPLIASGIISLFLNTK
ncbi:DUF441 family protein [Pantoea sp. Mhis]|uniref:DUF441 domain-containing protein n=1 Tax=Pantoea sp. Mhis TaxID=2576759 RepID=UPI00135791EB|nr:DUF441 family protein [Pantoea sp. Mhis]MXP56391.1 DUF441 domain-containing protein [Pantoea sp. Mhis]